MTSTRTCPGPTAGTGIWRSSRARGHPNDSTNWTARLVVVDGYTGSPVMVVDAEVVDLREDDALGDVVRRVSACLTS
ncbi:hypothetical protein Kisp02_31990 [Kineosporia sp. NBRC 101731]|nr:hypothetical protein [Kineosporia sp. NBRC 101731]GLY29834.1 hypothetical protein Kisp02_31990 [Kineosporia sp. NBRC 101731]